MLNLYLKDHPASVLYLYFINYTRKTYLLAILIIIVQNGFIYLVRPFSKYEYKNLGDIFFEVGFTSQTDKSTVQKSQRWFLLIHPLKFVWKWYVVLDKTKGFDKNGISVIFHYVSIKARKRISPKLAFHQVSLKFRH